MRIRGFILFCILIAGSGTGLFPGSTAAAQAQDSLKITTEKAITDSIPAKKDIVPSKAARDTATATPVLTLSLDSLRRIHSPRRAALYSAVLPGLGQAYNHQFVKVPLMLGGLGVAAGVFIFNFNKYVTYRDAYRLRLNNHYTNDPRVDVYSQDDLKYLRDGYRQYVDYSVLGFAAVYLYNILDAIVFAHLYHFDISNDLGSLRLGPVLNKNNPFAGFGLTYTFRK
jgi:hypothetical protein